MDLTIGKRLLQLRKQRNLSQQEIATQLGVTRQTISKWEQDLSLPDLDALSNIAEIFEVPITTLIGVKHQEDSISEIYEQIETVLKNIQKSNHSRNILQIILIIVCVVSLILTISMKIQLDKQTTPDSPIQDIYASQYMLADYSERLSLTDLNEFCITDGAYDQITRFDVSHYDLENWQITLDYHMVLKKYSPDTKISITFDDEGVHNTDLTFNFIKIADNEFILQETIPLHNYTQATLTVTNIDENIILEKLTQVDYLTQAIKSQIWLYLPFENHQLQLDQLTYQPSFIYNGGAVKFKGTLDGYLSIRFLDEKKQLLCDRITIDMSKKGTFALTKPLPTNQKIYIELEYSLSPPHQMNKTSGSFGRYNDADLHPYAYFEIINTNDSFNICHYKKELY